MHERLVEDWLDSANERSYQAPFCQMLSAQGHRIVHSSRHGAMELGKDIITVDADGTPCAFQLKGNPGGRLTLSEFRQIEAQLLDLVNLPLEHPGIPSGPHRSFLVTNGLVEEETIAAINALNRGLERYGFPDRKLLIIQRGDLLDMAKNLGYSLWPAELKQLRLILELLVDDGGRPFPIQKLHNLLIELLRLDENSRLVMRSSELRRRISSAAILVSVSLKNFQAKENYYAIVTAWVLFCVYAVAACERFQLSFARNAQSAVELGLTTIRDSMISLSNEVLERHVLVEGDPSVDAAVYRARYTLLLALMSILWFWCQENGWPDTLDKKKLKTFLSSGVKNLYLWGEAAVPQLLYYYWFLRETDPRSDVEGLLVQILSGLISKDSSGDVKGLPSPYYDFEDVSRHILAPILGRSQDPLRDDTTGIFSYYAQSLMHLLVRTGRKTTCKSIWPDVTRIQFVSFIPNSTWHYCLWRTEKGEYLEEQPVFTKQWVELVDEARRIDCSESPIVLKQYKYLHALFLMVAPYRGTPAVIRSLARRFDSTWFIAPPIGEGY